MKLLLFITAFFFTTAVMAQDGDTLPGNKAISVPPQYGFVLAHRPTITHVQKNHVKGVELEYHFLTKGNHEWEQPFLLPSYALSYEYLELGNPELLGGGHALTGKMIFPLNNNKIITTYVSSGFGIGYIEKKFDRIENFKSIAIGSHINAVVQFSFRAGIKTGKYSNVDAGINFTHFSNGSFKMPNLGINVPALAIGYTRYLGKPLERKIYQLPEVKKKAINKIVLGGGIKHVDAPHGVNAYGLTAAELSRLYILSHKSRLGGGIDLFYDRSLPWKLNSLYHEGLKPEIAFRAGIHAGYELTPGKWTILFQNGVYFYDKYTEDGFLYTKIGAEYSFTSKLFACFHLKSHFAKADYFEYGLGYQF